MMRYRLTTRGSGRAASVAPLDANVEAYEELL